jgi:hypothetical protein
MIYIVSQLAIGDAYLCRRFIVDELVRLNEEVCVLCNPNNAFIFDGIPIIIENWPLSPRRFKSIYEFKYLLPQAINLEEDVVVVPSGHFLEKVFSYIKFFSVKQKYFSRIEHGLRRKKNNLLFGNYIKSKYEIPILSTDAYGAHLEFFSKFYFKDRNLVNFQEEINSYIINEGILKVYIQISATVKSKSINNFFLGDLVQLFSHKNCRIIFIKDDPDSHVSIEYITPKEVTKITETNNSLFFLLDSFLLHYMSNRLSHVFCIISQIYANDWVPANGYPVSSIYSLYLWIKHQNNNG